MPASSSSSSSSSSTSNSTDTSTDVPVRDDIPDGYDDKGPDGLVPNEVPWKGMFS